jgi:phosphotriesterase-related protein
LGATLSHEHVLWDASFLFVEPEEKELAYEPVRIENLEWLKRNSLGSVDNLRLQDEDVAIEELSRFKKASGGAVVDMGNIGLRRDPEGLSHVSRATGVHIVMGSGYYVGASHPPELASRPVDELTAEIVHDVTVGVDGTGIRAGVIGEIGCSYPLMETEVKVLEAVAGAQRITGAPVNIHPGRSQSLPLEIIEMYREFGGDVGHTAMSHLSNRHGLDVDLTIELAKTGCYIEYDSFGNFMNPITLPEKTFFALSDWQRIECLKELIDHGFLDQLLISHDVFNKTDLRRYGGFGYDYIHETVVPMMRMLGISDLEIHAMLVGNPARFLQFD